MQGLNNAVSQFFFCLFFSFFIFSPSSFHKVKQKVLAQAILFYSLFSPSHLLSLGTYMYVSKMYLLIQSSTIHTMPPKVSTTHTTHTIHYPQLLTAHSSQGPKRGPHMHMSQISTSIHTPFLPILLEILISLLLHRYRMYLLSTYRIMHAVIHVSSRSQREGTSRRYFGNVESEGHISIPNMYLQINYPKPIL